MLEIITATKLKNSLLEILKRVEKGDDYLIIRRGAPSAVLISAEEYERMVETIRFVQNKEFLRKLIDQK